MRSRMSEKTGAAIRKLRLARGWNLATLSEQSGVPISTLSRVELGQNSLHYDKLIRLCRVLDVDADGLVARETQAAAVATGRRAVIRAGEGPPTRLAGNTGRRGAADLLSKSLSPLVLDVTARSLETHGPLATHAGEAYALVLAGQVELHSQLYAPLRLGPGDAVYFDAATGYGFIAPGQPARVLLVASGDTAFG